jgi:predicted aspartyl protease
MIATDKKILTLRQAGIVCAIKMQCRVSKPQSNDTCVRQELDGLTAMWDTGANITCISRDVAMRLNLKSVGSARVASANGINDVTMHRVDVKLPNGLCFYGLKVLGCDLATEDVLIGMDIISQGDFAYSTAGGVTTFSYCTPALHPIDFANLRL